MKLVYRLTLSFCVGVFFCLAGCAPKPTPAPPRVIYPLEPEAPTRLPNPTSQPTQTPLPTPVLAANAFTAAIYQQAAGLCARATEQSVTNLPTPTAAIQAPLLSMYAWSDKSEWEPASADYTHRFTEASSPDQVRSLICIQNHEYSAGIYTDGTVATRRDWTVYLLSWPEGVLLEKQAFRGGAPAAVKTGYGSGSGVSPSTAYFPWLLERFATGKMFFNYNSDVARLAFSPDGKYLAGTTGDAIKVWNLQSRQTVFAPTSEDWKMLRAKAVQFSPTGSALVLAGKGGLRIISVPEGNTIAELPGKEYDFTDLRDNIYDIDFNADGSRLAAGMYDGYREYASADLTLLNQAILSMKVMQVSYSPDGNSLIALVEGSVNKSGVYAWRLIDGSEVFFHRTANAVFSLIPSTSHLAIASEKSSRIWLYNLASGEQSGSLQGFRASTKISLLSADPNGVYLAALNDENHLIIWDLKSQSALSIRSGGKDAISAMQFSPDGSTLAIGFESGIIELWPTLP